jgi:hypothetical protein
MTARRGQEPTIEIAIIGIVGIRSRTQGTLAGHNDLKITLQNIPWRRTPYSRLAKGEEECGLFYLSLSTLSGILQAKNPCGASP